MKKTALAEKHEQLGARMVDFAGWYMPVQYSGIIDEHRAVRTAAGMFDLGHMGEVKVTGADGLAFLNFVGSNDIRGLEPGQAIYSLMLNPTGGVIDDIIIYRHPSGAGYFVVINASNTDKDVAWLQELAAKRDDLDVKVEHVSETTGMVAIQGPNAADIVTRVSSVDLNDMTPFSMRETEIAGVACLAGRTGYTGEDGWEFYFPVEHSLEVWDTLTAAGQDDGLQPIGLGARDTLRLEARMPLYGNEMNDEINPYDAGLAWAVKLDRDDFIGRAALLELREKGITNRTVGFKMVERGGAPRSHYEVQVDGKTVGFVTSGTSSPTLGENIGLAIIDKAYAGVGKPLDIIIRGKAVRAEQIKTPFYKRGV